MRELDDVEYVYCATNDRTGELFTYSHKGKTSFYLRVGDLRRYLTTAEKEYSNFWKKYYTIHQLRVAIADSFKHDGTKVDHYLGG